MGGTISQEELESWTAQQEHRKVAALETRINQLERQCAVLAAEIDLMRPVVEATVKQIRRDDDLFSWSDLKDAVDAYEAAKERG